MPDKKLTTAEAAHALGISERRVVALIHNGDLVAEKFGKSWAISAESVRQRSASDSSVGRPRFGRKNHGQIRSYTLMNKNDPVLDFVFDHEAKQVLRVEPREYVQASPVGACCGIGNPTAVDLGAWISNRYIPENRIGIKSILAKAGCNDPAELLFKTLGQNLTDQYWFKPEGISVDWNKINFFHNPYEGDIDAQGPGSGTPGMLPKWWERRQGKNFLIKGSGIGEREPFAEILATQLYERILQPGDFVRYSLEYQDERPYSVCEGFIDDASQLVSLREIMSCMNGGFAEPYDYAFYVDVCKQLGVEDIEQQLAKMIVCDYLMANIDRHDMNLGLVRDSETLEFKGVAPLFDNGRGFFFGAQRKTDFGSKPYFHSSHPFSEYPSQQLALVDDYSWFDPGALDGFTEDIKATLSQNELLPGWFPEAAARQFSVQLERVIEAKEERER